MTELLFHTVFSHVFTFTFTSSPVDPSGRVSRAPRDLPPESPTAFTLQHSSGSVSTVASEDLVMTVGDAEVRLRKSKKKKKRSSMIFISEERERTSTLDCKRVREAFVLHAGETVG